MTTTDISPGHPARLEHDRQPTAPARSVARRAVLHFIEMSIAMGLGMAILGPLARWGFSAAGWSAVFDHTDARAMVMATEMAVAMVAWMSFRRHSRGSIAEMTLAMYLPFVVLLPPYWAGMLSGGALMGIGHGVMMLAMGVVVYRYRHQHDVVPGHRS